MPLILISPIRNMSGDPQTPNVAFEDPSNTLVIASSTATK